MIDYQNDPNFRKGLEVGLACSLNVNVTETITEPGGGGDGGVIDTSVYGYIEVPIVNDTADALIRRITITRVREINNSKTFSLASEANAEMLAVLAEDLNLPIIEEPNGEQVIELPDGAAIVLDKLPADLNLNSRLISFRDAYGAKTPFSFAWDAMAPTGSVVNMTVFLYKIIGLNDGVMMYVTRDGTFMLFNERLTVIPQGNYDSYSNYTNSGRVRRISDGSLIIQLPNIPQITTQVYGDEGFMKNYNTVQTSQFLAIGNTIYASFSGVLVPVADGPAIALYGGDLNA